MTLSNEKISRMAIAGATLSRQCNRDFEAGQPYSYIRIDEFFGAFNRLVEIASLPGLPLLDIVDSADLQQIYLNLAHYKDQHVWNAARWEYEITKRVTSDKKT